MPDYSHLYGAGIDALFTGDSPVVPAPFNQAIQSKSQRLYDPATVNQALSKFDGNLTSFDPRTLSRTQPSVTKSGISHYQNSDDLYSDTHKASNKNPVVYTTNTPTGGIQNVILSGHHRATKALLNGEDLKAIHVTDPNLVQKKVAFFVRNSNPSWAEPELPPEENEAEWQQAYDQANSGPSRADQQAYAHHQLKDQGYSGNSFKETSQAAFVDHVNDHYRNAEDATNGYMLNPKAKRLGIDPIKLFTGNHSFANAHASDELKDHWRNVGGRPDLANFRESLVTGTRSSLRQPVMASASDSNDIYDFELARDRSIRLEHLWNQFDQKFIRTPEFAVNSWGQESADKINIPVTQSAWETQVATFQWGSGLNRCREIRKAAWHLINEDINTLTADPAISATDTGIFHNWNVIGDSPQTFAVYAYCLMNGINQNMPLNRPIFRGIKIDNIESFLDAIEIEDTFDMPLVAFSTRESATNLFGNSLHFVIEPGAKGVVGLRMDPELASTMSEAQTEAPNKDYEYITGGRFQVTNIEHNESDSVVTIRQIQIFDPNKFIEADANMPENSRVASKHIDMKQYDHIFDGTPFPDDPRNSEKTPKLQTKAFYVRTGAQWDYDNDSEQLSFQMSQLPNNHPQFPGYDRMTSYINGAEAGTMTIAPNKANPSSEHAPGEIADVFVHTQHRNKGLAREMAYEFQNQDKWPKHSPVLTADGTGFAKSTPELGFAPKRSFFVRSGSIPKPDDTNSDHTGAMVALVPTNKSKLTVSGGDNAEQLHMTVAYLGEASDWNKSNKNQLLSYIDQISLKSVSGSVMGHSIFNPDDSEKEPCAVYLVSELPDAFMEFKDDLVEKFKDLIPEQHNPWIGHITAGFNIGIESLDYTGAIEFDFVRVAFAGVNYDFPLRHSAKTAFYVRTSRIVEALDTKLYHDVMANGRIPKFKTMEHSDFVKTFKPGGYGSWDNLMHDRDFQAGGDEGFSHRDLVTDMKSNGFTKPIIVDGDEVQDGHHRVHAAGLAGVPVKFYHYE